MSGSTRGESRGGLRKAITDGVRVTAEMPDPRVARITIDIDWQHLVSRVARQVKHKMQRRGARSTPSRRATARRRSARS